ncbi:hypothetical protein SEUCBS140593_008370 [Sporothrix eucalyptigena]|uniref:Zn(2)-C6 fungal-type domain-containing protein n=1 Tax=Sporothrix eucalyptigena TaxID=1812306 RepID=A0ABP0CLK8_9PEZI
MHRRGHRKSRNGCIECKRRHMKCDESRPKCANCTTVHRQCQYADSQVSSRVPYAASATPIHAANTSPAYTTSPFTETSGTARSAEDGFTPALSPVSGLSRSHTTPQTSAPQTPRAATGAHDAGDQDEPVNVMHAELAFHFSMATTSPELDAKLVEMGNRVVVREAIKSPFLLYECLAVSARHLSILHPGRYEFFLRQSVQLQTKAIAMFNATESVDESNCVASVLFSSILNRHALIDVLANRDGDFFSFVDRFVQSVLLQKGIRVVSKEAWPQLLESDLRPIMKWATPDRDIATVGHHCDELRRLISLTPALEPVDKEACRRATHFLQLAFDSVTNPPPGKSAHQIVYIWGIFLPDEFCALLKSHRPEAIAVMAWYAVLLHQSRDNWQVGDAGVFMLNSIRDFLGPEWAHWLEWPFSVLRDGLH